MWQSAARCFPGRSVVLAPENPASCTDQDRPVVQGRVGNDGDSVDDRIVKDTRIQQGPGLPAIEGAEDFACAVHET